jgi:hypothetical protein
VLKETHAGGVTFNDWGWHVFQHDLPFGGIGNSGMGTYHGEEGFRELSHAKGVFKRHRWFPVGLFYPPYGNLVQRLGDEIFHRQCTDTNHGRRTESGQPARTITTNLEETMMMKTACRPAAIALLAVAALLASCGKNPLVLAARPATPCRPPCRPTSRWRRNFKLDEPQDFEDARRGFIARARGQDPRRRRQHRADRLRRLQVR